MKKITLLFTFCFALILNVHFVNAQSSNSITFQGVTIDMPKNIDGFGWNQLENESSDDEGQYVILQFDGIPNQNVQDSFRNNGVALTEYVSNNAYFAMISESISPSFLSNNGVISIVSVPNDFKMSFDIRNNLIGDWAQDGSNILVHLLYHNAYAREKFLSQINTVSGASIQEEYPGSNLMALSIPSDRVDEVASLPSVKWFELIPQPPVQDDDNGRSIHRASNLDTQTLTGRNYTGEGIGVMVRDDGIVGPHIDFQGRLDNSFAVNSGPTHGDGVAGIMAGAGNLDPTNRGMAAGANVFVVNYNSTHLDVATTTLIDDGRVQITNSSFSDGCNVGYTINARTVDLQMNNNLNLIHVFSAGNSNFNDCGYGAGNQWGNITGGHKQGKNVIATANVNAAGSLENSSSRGPAHDGRIKPDITAHGQGQQSTDENNGYLTFGGTSGAAPGIAGVSAQLYQLYNEKHGELPNASLIKATLLNTANDYGNVGPDFRFGWGLVNGLRAAMLLEDERHLKDQVSNGENKDHVINIPAGTSQVRFMVYWNDPSAVVGASTALVNDLDLKVTSPSSTEHLPWILDPTPIPARLDLPATNGQDRLNNMEQVLINNPEAGDYTLNVDGFTVPVGPQEYFIVYEIIQEQLTLTYPNGNEKFVPGEVAYIHWDATNTTETFAVEFSQDNGASWSSIATVSSSASLLGWLVPSSVTSGECKIRVTSGSFTDESDATFSIAGQVSGVNVTQVCPTTLTVEWNALTDATSYEVFLLGEKYMESVGTTSDTTLEVPIADPTIDFWVAVSATGGTNNWVTRRSNAIPRAGGLFNCPLSQDLTITSLETDFSDLSTGCSDSNVVTIEARISNEGSDSQTGFEVSYQLNSDAPVVETFSATLNTGENTLYTFTTPLEINADGDNTIKVSVNLVGDEYVLNNDFTEDFFSLTTPEPLNETQDFEGTSFPFPGWTLDNPDNNVTWTLNDISVGPDGNPTQAAYVNNIQYISVGAEDAFTTRVFNLNGTGLALNFDLAKAQFSSALQDGLRVEISTDCGSTYTTIYEKDGADLATIAGNVFTIWEPSSAAEWRKETVDLSGYENQEVIFKFVNICGVGNSTYIDNIEVTGVLSTIEDNFDSLFSLFPNPAEGSFFIRSTNASINTVEMFDLLGKKVKTLDVDNSAREDIEVTIEDLPSGIYIVRVASETGAYFKKMIKS